MIKNYVPLRHKGHKEFLSAISDFVGNKHKNLPHAN